MTASAALAAADVKADDTVLIGGAAGGVGVLAVQLAGLKGARDQEATADVAAQRGPRTHRASGGRSAARATAPGYAQVISRFGCSRIAATSASTFEPSSPSTRRWSKESASVVT